MKIITTFILLLSVMHLMAQDSRSMLIVVSAPGDPTYETEFARQAASWQSLAAKAHMGVQTIGIGKESTDGDLLALKKSFNALPKTGGDLWLVWIGHGSYDGRSANFNLRGQDIDSTLMRELLKPFKRRLIIFNLFSASAPFLAETSGKDRLVISSTRSNGERNYSRFGEKLADAITSSDADLDLDGSLSLLEVFLHASSETRAFYENEQRVLQEHAVIDDNGDGLGTSADSFKGLRAETKSEDEAAPDGATAREIHLLSHATNALTPQAIDERAKLESSIDSLRVRKPELTENDYYRKLEILMLKMAKLYAKQPTSGIKKKP
ncbi:MAG: hypothetical protein H8M99_07735 [Gloeobacteraceae cyanobacterium ES-bin-144]|nr:hypothetical protein [Verrucomicrobiales bacterium]